MPRNRPTHVPHFLLAAAACLASISFFAACNLQAPTQLPGLGNLSANDQSLAPTPTDSPLATAPEAADAGAAARAIEEADVLKFQDGFAYALNNFKGLFIIDVSKPDSPSITGHLDLKGSPVEMYILGTRAYVVASSQSYYPYADVALLSANSRSPDDAFAPPEFDGSKITIVDIADPANPATMGDIRLVGYASASRRVGDVIYVVGSDFQQAVPLGGDPAVSSSIAYYPYMDRGFVASINVADPHDIKAVQRETFEGAGINLHVSATALFVTSNDYYATNSGNYEPTTTIQYVDISDASGAIKLRGTATAPGLIRNRFYLDDFNNTLRIATESFGFGFQSVRLFTFDLSNPDNIQPLGNTEIIRGESLEAVRFDGPRAYAVTFLRVDPLFVIDLSDPAKPAVTGQLEVPGFSTHIEPRGDRLIAVGIDDTDGRRPAVAMYDVSDVKNPTQLSRIVLGPAGGYVDSAATYDEKAFKIVEELGLIAIPFNYYKPSNEVPQPGDGGVELAILPAYAPPGCVAAVQLIDYTNNGLTQRGAFEHRGNVERVGEVGGHVYAMSQLGFQIVNIDDRDKPQSKAFLPFVNDDELSYFDGCGYYTYNDVIFLPDLLGINVEMIRALLALLDGDNSACGVLSPMPLAGLLGFAGFVSLRNRRRRR